MIERVKREEQKDFINMLGEAFTSEYASTNFWKALPKMCQDKDEVAQKHFGIKENGKFVAGLGVYPLPGKVAGEDIVFSTMGNVGTLKEARGKGYMSELLEVAMKELADQKIDVSRLGGKVSRYNRYGYIMCGTLFHYSLDAFGHGEKMPDKFRLIPREDEKTLAACKALQEKELFHITRETLEDFYDVLIAWENIPYAYEDENGNLLGYVSIKKDFSTVCEIEAISLDIFKQMIQDLLQTAKERLNVELLPHRLAEKAFLDVATHSVSSTSPSLYKVMSIEPVMRAFLKLKAQIYQMPDMEQIFEIEGEGTFRVGFKNGESICERVTEAPEISYTYEEALAVIFATYNVNTPVYKSIFPLPLSWNGQDRV